MSEPTARDAMAAFEALSPYGMRCRITRNPIGTDTWPSGFWCACQPCQIAKSTASALAAERARVLGEAETFVDEHGVTWTRPTAEAYYRVCKALGAITAKLERVLTLTPEEAGRLWVDAQIHVADLDPGNTMTGRSFANECGLAFLAALSARAEGA